MKDTKGFTLIELLVVIAIIGILAAAVLGNLNAARAKGKDASVKSNLSGIRTQAEIYYDDNSGNYGDITNCSTGLFGNAIIARQLAEAVKSSTDTTATCTADSATSASKWAASVALSNDDDWCVDSSGGSGISTANAAGVCTY